MKPHEREQHRLAAEPTLFCALLTPHRSLGGVGFLVLMSVIAVVSFAGGVAFYLIGAWPGRLLLRARRGADLCSVPGELPRRRCLRGSDRDALRAAGQEGHPPGKVSEWSLNPVWVRLERETHEEFGLMRLLLVSHGRKLAVGSFLGPNEKESFAVALRGRDRRGEARTDAELTPRNRVVRRTVQT